MPLDTIAESSHPNMPFNLQETEPIPDADPELDDNVIMIGATSSQSETSVELGTGSGSVSQSDAPATLEVTQSEQPVTEPVASEPPAAPMEDMKRD